MIYSFEDGVLSTEVDSGQNYADLPSIAIAVIYGVETAPKKVITASGEEVPVVFDSATKSLFIGLGQLERKTSAKTVSFNVDF